MGEVTFEQAHARRLARHGLVEPHRSLADAAAAMGGVHAQVPSAAEVSLALRVAGATRSDVAAALWEERSLVRTFGPRGTVHLFATRDLAWWTRALEAVPRAGGHAPGVRLEPGELDAVVDALDVALGPGEPRTVEELDEAVARTCGEWAARRTMPAFGGHWPRWRQALGSAAGRGVLCFGPLRGRRVTYTSVRSWAPDLALPSEQEAVGRLLAAYLTAYGPATPTHLAQWLATTPRWARETIEAARGRGEVEQVRFDGEPAWVVAGDTGFDTGFETGAPADRTGPAVLLLPYFDALAVGSQPRSRLYVGRAATRALAGSQAGNVPVVLIDGVVGGVWHQRRSGRRVVVTVEMLGRLTARHRAALQERVERLGVILEARPELVLGPVTVGPHA